MANIKAKEKNIKKITKATKRNKAVKSRVKKAIKDAKIAVNSKASNYPELVAKAHKEINTANSKGIFHKNNSARKSSRLDMFVNKQTKKL